MTSMTGIYASYFVKMFNVFLRHFKTFTKYKAPEFHMQSIGYQNRKKRSSFVPTTRTTTPTWCNLFHSVLRYRANRLDWMQARANARIEPKTISYCLVTK